MVDDTVSAFHEGDAHCIDMRRSGTGTSGVFRQQTHIATQSESVYPYITI